jgi:hypothetical protein
METVKNVQKLLKLKLQNITGWPIGSPTAQRMRPVKPKYNWHTVVDGFSEFNQNCLFYLFYSRCRFMGSRIIVSTTQWDHSYLD